MSLLQLILTLAALGFILWLVNTYLPMDATLKKVMNIVVIIVLVLFLLRIFGLLAPLEQIRIGD